ncbi:Cell pattern formation-associated protein STUA [Wickerhamiella sorbophila]|uniref:Cell pattern formation-associated protein STUA n=1 Tax=Wickerhamiella sorbophila TaxID=45607 RepID=A0A2T0FCB6_9ASCO|nr:Cell pattern formation-associated protein STUA [Wickerhamiella sorbophila]PRT52605.1 Cell pattern formation-associated protein STUA [Wickerhamiella sorbophila]
MPDPNVLRVYKSTGEDANENPGQEYEYLEEHHQQGEVPINHYLPPQSSGQHSHDQRPSPPRQHQHPAEGSPPTPAQQLSSNNPGPSRIPGQQSPLSNPSRHYQFPKFPNETHPGRYDPRAPAQDTSQRQSSNQSDERRGRYASYGYPMVSMPAPYRGGTVAPVVEVDPAGRAYLSYPGYEYEGQISQGNTPGMVNQPNFGGRQPGPQPMYDMRDPSSSYYNTSLPAMAPPYYGSPVQYDPRMYGHDISPVRLYPGVPHRPPVPPLNSRQGIQQSQPRRGHRRQQSQPSTGASNPVKMKGVKDYPSLQGRLRLHPDSPGQKALPGWTGKVTTLAWEDEGTLCIMVEANGIEISRRCDNNMINGTKLLNYAGYTRGRRDGVLKHEQVRHVVKIGSMNLKGVWIPFERAMEMVQREDLLDSLYPLFVADLEAFLYHPLNLTRTLQVVRAAEVKNPVFRLWRESIPFRTDSSGENEENTSESGSGSSGVTQRDYYYN